MPPRQPQRPSFHTLRLGLPFLLFLCQNEGVIGPITKPGNFEECILKEGSPAQRCLGANPPFKYRVLLTCEGGGGWGGACMHGVGTVPPWRSARCVQGRLPPRRHLAPPPVTRWPRPPRRLQPSPAPRARSPAPRCGTRLASRCCSHCCRSCGRWRRCRCAPAAPHDVRVLSVFCILIAGAVRGRVPAGAARLAAVPQAHRQPLPREGLLPGRCAALRQLRHGWVARKLAAGTGPLARASCASTAVLSLCLRVPDPPPHTTTTTLLRARPQRVPLAAGGGGAAAGPVADRARPRAAQRLPAAALRRHGWGRALGRPPWPKGGAAWSAAPWACGAHEPPALCEPLCLHLCHPAFFLPPAVCAYTNSLDTPGYLPSVCYNNKCWGSFRPRAGRK